MARDYEPKLKVPKKNYKKGDLPESKEDWVSYINNLHDAALGQRKRYEFQWVINLAYFLGYQNLTYNSKTGSLEFPRDIRQPLTINRIASFVESRHAKLVKNRPIPRVMPNTVDPEDLRAAKYADQCLLHLWRKIGMESERDKIIMMMLLFGNSFGKTVWDPYIGDSIVQPKMGEENDLILDEHGGVEEEEIFLGEVCSKALSPFAILPANDMISDVKDQDWMIERSHSCVSYIEEIYPHLRGEIQKGDMFSDMTEHERIIQRLSSPLFQVIGGAGPLKKDSINSQALVKTFMMKPNYQYEEGILAIVIGDKLAMIDKWPNDYGDNIYPYVKFQEKNTGLHFWNQSTIERLIPIQKAYNNLKKQKLRNASLMGSPKWLVAKGSQLQEDALNDDVEVLEWNPAVPEPHPSQPAPMPNYISELARELIVDFRDAGGQRESSVTPPPNVTAGVAMSTASELADEIITPIIQRTGDSFSKMANTQLLIMNQEWTEPRKVKIIGEGNEFGIMWLSSADLKNHTDVHIEIESLFPEFRGAKRQTLFDLWDRKIVQDPQKILKAFRYGNWDSLMEEEDKIDEAVWLEIARIRKGKEPEITPFQNQMAYVKRLTQWIQTPEFQRLIPERKQLAIQVLQARMGMIMQQMPGGGEPMAQPNPNAVGSPFGSTVPAGARGNIGPQG